MGSSGPPAPGSGVAQKRAARKLHKKCQDGAWRPVELPEPLRDSDSDEESSPHDVAPTRLAPMPVNMNQSIFGLIAAAGSRVNFNERFDDTSSDDDAGQPQDLSKTVILDPSAGRQNESLSGHRLLRSFSTLPRRKPMASCEASQSSAPVPSLDSTDDSDNASPSVALALQQGDPRVAPVMSRMLQARAEMSSRLSFDLERPAADASQTEQSDDATTLAKRLMEIFGFDKPEQVIEGL